MFWYYYGKPIKSIEDFGDTSPFGFVYIVTHMPTDMSYIGKKVLHFSRKKKLGKKALARYIGKGRKPNHIIETKESDWKTYFGSEDRIKTLLKEGREEEFKREIVYLAPNKKLLTYEEVRLQFELRVLENQDKYFNSNILGKFFPKDFH